MMIKTTVQMGTPSSSEHLRLHLKHRSPDAIAKVEGSEVIVSYEYSIAGDVGEQIGFYITSLESYKATATNIRLKNT
ncbi:hypothetical protein [Sulfitobacter sp. R18_1]|uniref:hypothetical protein n=1 Tax=Sulfitobacter sp. R18_1 TaxID=2821104 RepID=UPI001ADAEBEE|nr:hypothetical protein [Sulfitobacter sp. R18_1]MBO9428110.1 hypothetical protein [Sulfitobacter sp. R18_1]